MDGFISNKLIYKAFKIFEGLGLQPHLAAKISTVPVVMQIIYKHGEFMRRNIWQIERCRRVIKSRFLHQFSENPPRGHKRGV